MNRIVGVIGSSSVDKDTYAAARQVGELLAESGATVICGGLSGVMEAVCEGARSRDGVTIGILPGNDIADANRFVQYPIATGLAHGRNLIIINTARALIAISKGYGTLSEIAFALASGKPVIGLDTWEIKGVIASAGPEDAVARVLDFL